MCQLLATVFNNTIGMDTWIDSFGCSLFLLLYYLTLFTSHEWTIESGSGDIEYTVTIDDSAALAKNTTPAHIATWTYTEIWSLV